MSPLKPYTAILRDKRRSSGTFSSMGEWLAVFQGVYYCISGLWPLVAMQSFLAVTGPKTDLWLVKAVGSLVLVIGGVLIVAAIRSVLTLELGLLMIGVSLALGLIDVIFVLEDVLSPVYLADAVEEFIMMVLCLIFLRYFTHRRHSTLSRSS